MTDKEFSIRNYVDTDYNRILELNTEFSDFFEEFDKWQKVDQDTDAVAKYYLDKNLELIKKHDGAMYVAEAETLIVGFAAMYIREQSEEEALTTIPMRLGHLESLFVSGPYRSQGVGEALIKRAEDYFRSKDCTHSELDVFGPNTKAHNFYERNGYEDIKMTMIKAL